jgi:hypothetical protein
MNYRHDTSLNNISVIIDKLFINNKHPQDGINTTPNYYYLI